MHTFVGVGNGACVHNSMKGVMLGWIWPWIVHDVWGGMCKCVSASVLCGHEDSGGRECVWEGCGVEGARRRVRCV